MRSLFRYFRAAWLFARFAPPVVPAAWDDEDRVLLARFLESSTGTKLGRILVETIDLENERAAFEATRLAAGRAQGFKAPTLTRSTARF